MLRRRHHSAFTLVEIVIVTAIILVLAGMAIPAVQTVVHAARRMSCASNLRQLGIAALAYAGDHGDLLPAAEKLAKEKPETTPAWFVRLPEYLGARDVARGGRVFQCAAWKDAPRAVFTEASPKSLKWNARLDDQGRARHYQLGTWSDESQVCLMADAKAGETGMGQWGHLVETGIDDRRHRGQVNVLCLDGHSQLVARCRADQKWCDAIRWVGGD